MVATFPPAGPVARLQEEQVGPIGFVERGIPVRRLAYRGIVDLPEPTEDRLLIVSRVTAWAIAGRDDLFFPDQEVRDEAGAIVGCGGLAQFLPSPGSR